MNRRIGWWLMGWPVGVRGVWKPLLRYGPYRWGAWLFNRRALSGPKEEQ